MIRSLIATTLIGLSLGASALQDNSKVPVLAYHSRNAEEPCTDETADVLAMARDIEIARSMGFTIVPLQDVVDWQLGRRASASLPDKVLAITSDDGFDRDWISDLPAVGDPHYPDYPCHGLPSVKRIAVVSKTPVTLFVIASRAARNAISPDWFNDNWWAEAGTNPYLSIQNHTTDHEHNAIQSITYDPAMMLWVPISGYGDSIWSGQNNPRRWNTYTQADLAINAASGYIGGKTGKRPTMLAHPFGVSSDYVRDVYLPGYQSEHKLDAAFGIEPAYVTRQSNRWMLPRFMFGLGFRTESEIKAILGGAQ